MPIECVVEAHKKLIPNQQTDNDADPDHRVDLNRKEANYQANGIGFEDLNRLINDQNEGKKTKLPLKRTE